MRDGHPYRTAEEPILIASRAGLDIVKESLDRLVRRIEEADLTLSGLVESVAVSGSITTMAAVSSPGIAAATLGIIAAWYLSKESSVSSSKTANSLVSLCREVFAHNVRPYEKKLQEMLVQSRISYDVMAGVPADYVQPLLLDYAISQHRLWLEHRELLKRIEEQGVVFSDDDGLSSDKIRRDESIRASMMMDMQTLGVFVDYIIERKDYDTLFVARSSSPYTGAASLIAEKAVSHFDGLIESGDEKGMYAAAQSFADFGHWKGLRQMYSWLIENGEMYPPEHIATSILPVTDDDERQEYSSRAVWELFDVFIDHSLFRRAEDLIPFLKDEDKMYIDLLLDFLRYHQEE